MSGQNEVIDLTCGHQRHVGNGIAAMISAGHIDTLWCHDCAADRPIGPTASAAETSDVEYPPLESITAETAELAAIRDAHPVTESRRCGNRISEPINPPPGPPSPPIWCARPADGHDPDGCTTYDGRRLSGWAWGGLTIEVHPPVVTYRCETCRSEQDHRSPAPCATLTALARVTPPGSHETPGGEDRG